MNIFLSFLKFHLNDCFFYHLIELDQYFFYILFSNRFGSFEIFREEDSLTNRSGPSAGNKELLIQLLDYSIKSFYPEVRKQF